MKAKRFTCRIILSGILACCCTFTKAQSPSAYLPTPVEISRVVDTVLGKPYRVHTVLKGHTLYSICKAYRTTADAILKDSPGNQVQADEFIYIPIDSVLQEGSESFAAFEGKRPWAVVFLEQERQAKQSGRAYATDMSDEKTAGPESEKGKGRRERKQERLAAREEAKADALDKEKKTSGNFSEPEHYPQDAQASNETAGIPIPEIKGNKDTLRISLLLPLYSRTPKDRKAYIYLPFFEGASVAWQEYLDPDFFSPATPDSVHGADSVMVLPVFSPVPSTNVRKKNGPVLELRLFDLTESVESLNRIMADNYFLQSDAILAAAFIDQFAILDSVARFYEIPLIHPVSERDSMAVGNPYFIQLAASHTTQLRQAAQCITAYHADARILIISDSSAPEIKKAECMQSLLPGSERYLFNPATAQMLETFSENTNPVVIVPFYQKEITAVKTVLPLRQTKGNITIVAPDVWLDFGTIDLDYFIQNNLTTYGTFHCTNQDTAFMDFSKKYYFLYHGLPNTLAYQGYRSLSWLIEMLSVHNADFIRHLNEDTENIPAYDWMERGTLGGWENGRIHVIKIGKNGPEEQVLPVLTTDPPVLPDSRP